MTNPPAGCKQMTSFTLSTNELWPDQGLNRIIAAVEKLDTDDFNEVECLEMLIYLSSRRRDARHLAEATLEAYGSLAKVFRQPSSELRELLRMDHAVIAIMAIVKSSMKRALRPEMIDRHTLPSYKAFVEYFTLALRSGDQEIFRVVYLDADHRIIKDEEMSRGTVDAVSIYPKEVAKRAIAYCASSVILAHNHLGDDATPSDDDIKATIKTKGALKFVDVTLHDHMIVSRRHCFSMRQRGLI